GRRRADGRRLGRGGIDAGDAALALAAGEAEVAAVGDRDPRGALLGAQAAAGDVAVAGLVRRRDRADRVGVEGVEEAELGGEELARRRPEDGVGAAPLAGALDAVL